MLPSDGGTRLSSSSFTCRRPLPIELNYELLKCVPTSSDGILLLCTSHTMLQLFSGQKRIKLWRRKVHLEQDRVCLFGNPSIHAIMPSDCKAFDGFDDVAVKTRYCSKLPDSQGLRFVVFLCSGGVSDATAVAECARAELEGWSNEFDCQITEMGNQGCGMPLLEIAVPFEQVANGQFCELLKRMDALISQNHIIGHQTSLK